MFSLKGLVSNFLFLIFNLGIFYAIYWAYKEDRKKEEQRKKDRDLQGGQPEKSLQNPAGE